MQKHILLLFALVGGSIYTLSAQQLERAVINTAGEYQSGPTMGNLHWTVGEVIVEEFRNGKVLSQGFIYSLNYAGFSVLAIKAIQEQQKEIRGSPSKG